MALSRAVAAARLLPGWHADAGEDAGVDFIVEEFRRRKLARKLVAA